MNWRENLQVDHGLNSVRPELRIERKFDESTETKHVVSNFDHWSIKKQLIFETAFRELLAPLTKLTETTWILRHNRRPIIYRQTVIWPRDGTVRQNQPETRRTSGAMIEEDNISETSRLDGGRAFTKWNKSKTYEKSCLAQSRRSHKNPAIHSRILDRLHRNQDGHQNPGIWAQPI